jgi:hypothetical protein
MGRSTARFYRKRKHHEEKRLDPESATSACDAEDRDKTKERGYMTLTRMIRSIGIAACLLLAGCSGLRSSVKNVAQGPQTPTVSNLAPPVEVIRADGTSVTLVYATIANLPLQMLIINGKTEQGPTVPDVLAAADVKDFSQVAFFGLENRTLTFTREQLNDQIILALREHPRAVNLMSPNIPEAQWVLHVFRVEVQ